MTARGGASAPGKLMLAGEYAVLQGAEALVAAVSARATVRWSDPGADASQSGADRSGPALPPEAAQARKLAEEMVGAVPQELTLDARALRRDGRKLGLGSSSAAAAAAAGAVFAARGQDLGDEAVRRRVLDAAMRGHTAIAPEGSGADVAAPVLGGVIRFRRRGDAVSAVPVAWPAAFVTRVVWTGVPVRTSELVRRVNQLADRNRDAFVKAMDGIGCCAGAVIEAVEASDPEGLIAAVAEHHDAMAALGRAAEAPIVEERLTRIAALARDAGGAAKPSGAGGGDVALAFFGDTDAAGRFERAAAREPGLTVLDLTLGAEGVREER